MLYDRASFGQYRIRNFNKDIIFSNVGSFNFDIKTKELWLSPGVWRILGMKPQEIVDAEQILSLLHPDDRKDIWFSHGKSIDFRTPKAMELRIQKPDGTTNVLHLFGKAFFDASGNPSHIQGTIQDISNQIAIQKRVNRYRVFERAILNLSQSFINKPFEDLSEIILEAVQSMREYCEAQRIAVYRYDFVNGEAVQLIEYGGDANTRSDQSIPLLKIEQAVNAHELREVYRELRVSDDGQGHASHHTVQMYPIAAGDELKGFFQIEYGQEPKDLIGSREIMVRIFAEILAAMMQKREREILLQDAIEQNRLAIDASRDGIVIFDREGNILNINQVHARRFQSSVADAIGANMRDYIPESKYGKLWQYRLEKIQGVFDEASPISFEDNRDGMWFENRIFPVLRDGKVTAVALFSAEVTESKLVYEQAINNENLRQEAEVLRRREQEYLELLDGSSEGSWIYDFKSQQMDYSQCWGERLGNREVTIETMHGLLDELIHPRDRERFSRQWFDAISRKLPKHSMEYRVKTPENEYIWLLDRSKILFYDDGTPQKIYTTTTDITEQKNNELILNRQNRVLREINHIYEQAFLSDTVEMTAKGCLDVVKAITESPIGMIYEQGIGTSPQTFVFSTPERTKINSDDLFALRSDPLGYVEIVLKDGRSLLNNSVDSLHDDRFPKGHPPITCFLCVPYLRDGQAMGLIGVANRLGGYRQIDLEMLETLTPTVFEVLLRKQAEDDLRKSRNTLQMVIESAPDPIFLKDRNSRIVLANTAMGTRRVGLTLDRLIGNSFEHIEDPSVVQQYMEADTRILDSGTKEEIEEDILTPSGPRTYITSKSPWYDVKGDVVGLVCVSRDITERKKMEEELRKSEEKYRTLFNSIDEAFCIIELLYDESGIPKDFVFIETNPAFAKHSGQSDVIGKRMSELAPNLEETIFWMLGELLHSNEPARYEGEAKALQRWFDVYAFMIGGPEPNRIGVLFRDITDRKMIEKELLRNESLLRSMIEGTADSIFLKDDKSRILLGNSAFARAVGRPIEEILGKDPFEYRPNEVAKRMRADDLRVMESDKEEFIEEEVPAADGSQIRMLSTIKTPWHNENGEVIGLIGVSRDISVRVKMEKALRSSEALLRSVIEEITDPIYLKDKDKRIIMANRAFSQMVGIALDDLLDKSVFEYREDPITQLKVEETDNQVMQANAPLIYEQTSLSPDKSNIRTFLTTKVPWHNEKGEVIGLIGISREISERKKIEEELKKTALDLEQKNRLITDFFTNMTHELKTPLTIILVQLELMRLCMSDEQKMPDLISSATQNSYRLLRLVGNLLDITRIDGGHLQAIMTDADAVALVQSIVKTVDAYAKAKSIRLTFSSTIKEKMMPLDIEKTERILLNLLSNAIKYTDVSGRIAVKMEEKNDGGISVSVEDNGVGIPEDKIEIIFDRFAQVDSSFSKQAEGCGIGLALVKSLVQVLGGTIGVRSRVGKGSCFTMTLPMMHEVTDNGISMYDVNLSKKAEMELSDLNLGR